MVRLMRRNNLRGTPSKRRWKKKSSEARPSDVENLLERDFTASEVNQKWVTDISYIETKEGWLYLCIVKDLHNSKIVGWSMNARQTTELAIRAVAIALQERRGKEPVIVHSDRGGQFVSSKYRSFLKKNNLISSMNRKGSCADNASAESFFGQLKRERVNKRNYRSRWEAGCRHPGLHCQVLQPGKKKSSTGA